MLDTAILAKYDTHGRQAWGPLVSPRNGAVVTFTLVAQLVERRDFNRSSRGFESYRECKMANKGTLEVGYTVWCGECGNWEQTTGLKPRCMKVFRKRGWKLTKDRGWLCKTCHNKTKSS